MFFALKLAVRDLRPNERSESVYRINKEASNHRVPFTRLRFVGVIEVYSAINLFEISCNFNLLFITTERRNEMLSTYPQRARILSREGYRKAIHRGFSPP